MKKILQITDLHLKPPGQELKGLEPARRLDAAIEAIRTRHSDAGFCVISGDLANNNKNKAYRHLKTALEALPMPVHLMMGNNDRRAKLRKHFPDRCAVDQQGFIQTAVEAGSHVFLLLDTVQEGTGRGQYCAARAEWLTQMLKHYRGKNISLFMHHPPFAIGIPTLDPSRIADTRPLEAALKTSNDLRHLFFGHVHRPITGNWQGISFSALPSLNHQTCFCLPGQEQDVAPYCHEPPMIGVILLQGDQITLHYDNFTDHTDSL